MPYDPRMPDATGDKIVFKFGADRPTGFPIGWIIPVTEQGLVPVFTKISYERKGMRDVNDVDTVPREVSEAMTVGEVRKMVGDTKPRL